MYDVYYRNSDETEIVEGSAWGKIINVMQFGKFLDPVEGKDLEEPKGMEQVIQEQDRNWYMD